MFARGVILEVGDELDSMLRLRMGRVVPRIGDDPIGWSGRKDPPEPNG